VKPLLGVERVRQMAGRALPGRRGHVHPLVLLARGLRKIHPARPRPPGRRRGGPLTGVKLSHTHVVP
jgi:hypothetical protein